MYIYMQLKICIYSLIDIVKIYLHKGYLISSKKATKVKIIFFFFLTNGSRLLNKRSIDWISLPVRSSSFDL